MLGLTGKVGRFGQAALGIEGTGALASTETMIDELLDQSLASLDGAGLSDDAREVLTGLAYAATRRSV